MYHYFCTSKATQSIWYVIFLQDNEDKSPLAQTLLDALAVSCPNVLKRSSLSINALCACVYIYIWQLSSFRAPTLWFINMNVVTTSHIQYTFLSLCPFFMRKWTKSMEFINSPNLKKGHVEISNLWSFSFSKYFTSFPPALMKLGRIANFHRMANLWYSL